MSHNSGPALSIASVITFKKEKRTRFKLFYTDIWLQVYSSLDHEKIKAGGIVSDFKQESFLKTKRRVSVIERKNNKIENVSKQMQN